MSLASYVHVFVPATTADAPPLLLLHGTGGNEHDLVDLARRLSPGSALLSPRGDVPENGALRFFRRHAEGVFDLPDVERRADALAAFVAAAAESCRFDARRLVALGFSNGANMAASLLLRHPAALAGAVLWRPMVVLEPAAPPDLRGRRLLISSGRADPIVPVDHPERLASLLRAGGAEVRVQWLPGGHGLMPADFSAAAEFLGAQRAS